MTKTSEKKEEILHEMDSILATHGFNRKKRSSEWHRVLNKEVSQAIGLGMALYPRIQQLDIHPQVSVRYESIERELVEAGIVKTSHFGERSTFGVGIDHITQKMYWITTDEPVPELVWTIYGDILQHGFPFLERFSNIEQIIMPLISKNPRDWLDSGASYRARLLPLALAVSGKKAEALSLLSVLTKELEGKDQMIPNYQHFTTWFSQKYSDNSER